MIGPSNAGLTTAALTFKGPQRPIPGFQPSETLRDVIPAVVGAEVQIAREESMNNPSFSSGSRMLLIGSLHQHLIKTSGRSLPLR